MRHKSKGFYLKDADGLFVCPVCLERHVYSVSAIACCNSRKPATNAVMTAARLLLTHHTAPLPRRTPRTARPGDAVEHRDKWQHWRRGRKRSPKQTRSVINRAWGRLERSRRQAETADLERLAPSYELVIKEDRSPRQRLAFAHYTGNYNAARNALDDGINEAVSQAVRETAAELVSPSWLDVFHLAPGETSEILMQEDL
jgi:hypothetical protein